MLFLLDNFKLKYYSFETIVLLCHWILPIKHLFKISFWKRFCLLLIKITITVWYFDIDRDFILRDVKIVWSQLIIHKFCSCWTVKCVFNLIFKLLISINYSDSFFLKCFDIYSLFFFYFLMYFLRICVKVVGWKVFVVLFNSLVYFWVVHIDLIIFQKLWILL